MVLVRVPGIERDLTPWAMRHGQRIEQRLIHQYALMRPRFEAIAASSERVTLDDARTRVSVFLQGIDFA